MTIDHQKLIDMGARKKKRRAPALVRAWSFDGPDGKRYTAYTVIVDGRCLGRVEKTHAGQWSAKTGRKFDECLGVRAKRHQAVALLVKRFYPRGLDG